MLNDADELELDIILLEWVRWLLDGGPKYAISSVSWGDLESKSISSMLVVL